MLPLEHPDRIQIAFDDHHLVNNAGLLLPATLAHFCRPCGTVLTTSCPAHRRFCVTRKGRPRLDGPVPQSGSAPFPANIRA